MYHEHDLCLLDSELADIACAVDRMRRSQSTPAPCSCKKWRAVDDKMPDGDMVVMVHHIAEDEPVWMGYYDDESSTWRTVEGSRCMVSHWAEIPDSPNSELSQQDCE